MQYDAGIQRHGSVCGQHDLWMGQEGNVNIAHGYDLCLGGVVTGTRV